MSKKHSRARLKQVIIVVRNPFLDPKVPVAIPDTAVPLPVNQILGILLVLMESLSWLSAESLLLMPTLAQMLVVHASHIDNAPLAPEQGLEDEERGDHFQAMQRPPQSNDKLAGATNNPYNSQKKISR